MNDNNIGLIIWGLRGGYRIFCSNNVVDYKQPVIRDTLKDIRSFVRFIQNRLNVYALEFTDQYKIYTLYRSCFDSSNGAFVAFTVYVPHSKSVTNMVEVLDHMMDDYFREYLNPLDSTYLPGKYDNIEPYTRILNSEAKIEPETRRNRFKPSTQNDIPDVFVYNSIEEVKEYFKTPYRREFFECQEVMFMSREIFQGQSNTLSFNRPPKVIEKVSAPDPLPHLKVDSTLRAYCKSISVNGESYTLDKEIPLNDSDTLTLVLHKQYYKDKKVSGTVINLKNNRILQEIGKEIHVNIRQIQFEPEIYKCVLTINGKSINGKSDLRGCIRFTIEGENKPFIYNGGEIELSGDKAYSYLTWGIKPYPYSSEYVESSNRISLKSVFDSVNKTVDIKVKEEEYTLSIDNKVKRPSLYLIADKGRTNIKLNINQQGGRIKLLIPSDKHIDFDCKSDDMIVKQEGNSLLIEACSYEYELVLPESVRQYIKEIDWDFTIKGKSRKISYNKIRLEKGENIDNCKFISRVPLQLGVDSVDIIVYTDKNEHTIEPKGYLVIPPVKSAISIGKSNKWIISRPTLFKDAPAIERNLYNVEEKKHNELTIFNVSRKTQNSIGYNNGGQSTSTPQNKVDFDKPKDAKVLSLSSALTQSQDTFAGGISPSEEKQVRSLIVNVYNCEKGEIKNPNGSTTKISKSEDSFILEKASYVSIIYKGRECIIYKDRDQYVNSGKDSFNRKNGFDVRYSGDGASCQVTNVRKKNAFANLSEAFSKKVITLALVAAVVLAGAWALIYYLISSQSKTVLELEFVSTLNNDNRLDSTLNFLKSSPSVTFKTTDSELNKWIDEKKIDINKDGKVLIKVSGDELKDPKSFINKLNQLKFDLTWRNGKPECNQEWTWTSSNHKIDIASIVTQYMKDKKTITETITIEPEVYQKVKDFNNTEFEDSIKKYKRAVELKDSEPVLLPYLKSKCSISLTDALKGIKDNSQKLSKLQEYKEILGNDLFDSEFDNELATLQKEKSAKDAQIEEQQRQEEEKIKHQKKLDTKCKTWIDQLQSDNCTRQTVAGVQRELDKMQSDEDKSYLSKKISPYLKAYNTFFSAKNMGDMNKCKPMINHYSPFQKTAILSGFLKGETNCNKLIERTPNFNFNTPHTAGVL